MKKILLIEDEPHKREELLSYLSDLDLLEFDIQVCGSVRDAVLKVIESQYDLIILDMALPTFSSDGSGQDGGLDQALGGVEILRALQSQNKKSDVLIVTQHPDIMVSGKKVKLKTASKVLSKQYGQNVVGAVLYRYKSPLNRPKIKKIMDEVL